MAKLGDRDGQVGRMVPAEGQDPHALGGPSRDPQPGASEHRRNLAWPESRGLSPSELCWRSDHAAWLVKAGAEIGADGLLGRLRMGNGIAIFSQMDPNQFEAETATFRRY
jgi:hypothetical protein